MNRARPSDRITLVVATFLLLASIAFVYSASAEFANVRLGSAEQLVLNHSIRVGISILLMVLISRIRYHVIASVSQPLLVLSIVLLLFVLIEGVELKGAVRWLDVAGISFQPSELAKFALLFHLAVRMAQLEEHLRDFRRGFLPLIAWAAVVATLVALQPNLSTAVLIFALAMMLLFVGGARLGHLVAIGAVGLCLAGLYAVSAEYRMQRLAHYFGGDSAPSYQLEQALLGFGNGGLIGVGPGQSRQRDLFLPEPYGDFIAAIIGEEYGFIGSLALLGCYAVLVVRGVRIAQRAADGLGFLLAWAVTLVIGWYAAVNVAVSCGVLPTTGIPLPLVSYGGSSVVLTACGIGVLLSVSRYSTTSTAPQSATAPLWSSAR